MGWILHTIGPAVMPMEHDTSGVGRRSASMAFLDADATPRHVELPDIPSDPGWTAEATEKPRVIANGR
jgi:hypothetical protein